MLAYFPVVIDMTYHFKISHNEICSNVHESVLYNLFNNLNNPKGNDFAKRQSMNGNRVYVMDKGRIDSICI